MSPLKQAKRPWSGIGRVPAGLQPATIPICTWSTGTQPAAPNSGVAKIEGEKIVLAKADIREVLYKPAATNNTGAGCVIEDIPEAEDVFDANSILGGDAMSMRNIIFKHSDGEDGIEDVAVDLCNSPIKDAAGWADAPADAKEFYCVTSDGLIRPAVLDPQK